MTDRDSNFGQRAGRGSAHSAHAPSASVSPPPNASGGPRRSTPTGGNGARGRGHQGSASYSSNSATADPMQAMNNLQHLIQDMKTQQAPAGGVSTPPQPDAVSARSTDRDAQASLAAFGDRLAAQEEQLQTQLQQQLNLQAHGARGGGLPIVGENTEMSSEDQDGQQQHSFGRPLGPRFAGNAAFQSAMARHSQAGRQSGLDARSALAHQRQASLQGRFADLGYTAGSLNNLGTIAGGDFEDGSTDDGSSVADFMGSGGFDPTRQAFQSSTQAQQGHQQGSFGQHRGQRLGHASAASASGSFPGQTDFVAEQIALQQQIEMLQLQQQQLLQQQVNFNPSLQLGGQPQPDRASHPGFGAMSGHRRIHSHAPQSGLANAGNSAGALSNFNVGGIGSIGALAQAAPISAAPVPRGHGRRHSVNVVKAGGGGGVNSSADSVAQSQARSGFMFPNNPVQAQAQAQVQAQAQAQQPFGRQSGHFSHPSVQLSSSLSPEYLMAGGGLLNLTNFGMGSELADGFGGGGPAMGRGGHNRTGSQNWRINGAPGAGPMVADLAQAQAQLASLHQFRSQAGAGGGGHSKHPSFSGGFNPALMGQFGGQFGGPGAFGPGGQQGQGNNAAAQRKALFGSYLPQASLPPLLAAGKIVVGQIRVDKRNRSDAYVSTEVLDSDIYISGSRDRNRALSGDIVAVELLDPQEVWLNKKAKEDKKKHKEEQGTVATRKPDKAKDDLEVEGAQLRLIDEEEDTEQAPPALAGHVVAIVERTPGQLFCGTIGLLRPSSAATKEKQQQERALREGNSGVAEQTSQEQQQRPKIVWHRPLNKTTPLIAIPADQAPAAFWEPGGQEKYATIMVTVAIKRWPITSLHPFGTLVEEIGVMGNIEAETQAILKDNISSATEEFSESSLKCVPPLPFVIPPREYEVRRDFREQCVFTIDPPTARDLDDAVSVRRLDGGLFEIGVHIADVSHFVKLNSALDRDARKRCTSVYLVQRALPMLPRVLSEELCSLVPGVERLCFSAVFKMNSDARIVDSWFGRTVIKSCSQLAYSDAQSVIDTGSLPEGKEITGGHSRETVTQDIKTLHDLAQVMRRRRFAEGALRIDNVKLNFRLDDDGLPTDASVAQGREANQLIEEFMLTANTAVSQRIAAGMPDTALLRRHEAPLERRLEGFQRRAEQMGLHVDISSSGALYASLRKIGEKDPQSRFALETLATKSMLRAKYFCAGMTDISKYGHYALNVPVYTHFTSPIRRYADVMVHRQLDAVLQGQDKFGIDREGMAKIAQQCNVKRDAAKLAQEASQHLFLCLLVHDLTVRYGPVMRQATVTGVLDAAFDIVVPEFGIEKRVHIDQIPVQHHTYEERDHSLSIYWRQGVDTISWLAETSDDPHVKALQERARRQREVELSSQSRQDEASLFDDDDASGSEDGGTEDDAIRKTALAEAKRRLLSGEDAKDSVQRTKSRTLRTQDLVFEGVGADASQQQQQQQHHHHIQTVKVLQTVPVVISASVGTKSPPVLTVFAVNPFA
ncbi:unnamed protein product [Parajaminaea phylloscopi]